MLNFKEFVLSQVGKIFIIGVLLFILYLGAIGGIYLYSSEDAHNIVIMTFANLFFGRAAGISFGFSAHFSDIAIMLINMFIEFLTVMLIYPFFVLSWEKSLDIKMLRSFFIKVKKQKIKYKDLFEKYGKYGLFLFVWFPFWMTGPVVGAIIGFLIGIKHYTTMFIVLAGTFLATAIWTYFLKELIALLNYLSSHGAYIILAIFIVLGIVLKLKKSKKTKIKREADDLDDNI
ncbi:MAG: small multi-drug export protein [Sulfurimonas sp.]|uniref:small multi-drug export protein n=1 Tax=Sulfurimonas sp. TaxID=2022749 RepID=UPI002604F3F4|nr:small multi-drug export protein [Sulfurimonas sp.]MCW8894334.1 small multi-drug export protein [Sulfurimonas sp.]MCW8954237.1 small multi-drug export protein [Sulfurimonas sp.]MCW9066843.1 small multi-drug export protein [Sulfurimonas sp.]